MTAAYDFLWSLDQRNKGQQLRLGMARVRSVEGDPVFGTVSGQAVIVPASNDWITAEAVPAKYLSEYPPRPGASCWYATDGNDVLILGMVAPEGPPACSLERTSTTAIANNSAINMSFEVRNLDPWNMMDASGTAIRIPVTGLYKISGQTYWASGTVGYRQMNIDVNGQYTVAQRVGASPTSSIILSTDSEAVRLNIGDLVGMKVVHTQGANLNVTQAMLGVTYVGRARSTDTSNILSTQINPTDDPGWSYVNNPSVSFSQSGIAAGTPAIFIESAVGTVLTVSYSPETFPVVPRQRYALGARVRTVMSGGTGVGTAQYLNMSLLCAANGVPDPTLTSSSVVTAPTVYAAGTATFTQYNFGTVTIPDGVFTARVGLQLLRTVDLKTGFFNNLTVTEVIS